MLHPTEFAHFVSPQPCVHAAVTPECRRHVTAEDSTSLNNCAFPAKCKRRQGLRGVLFASPLKRTF